MSRENSRLKIGKALAIVALIAFMSLAIVTPRGAIKTAAAKSATEERAE
jgi:hypothetical protein